MLLLVLEYFYVENQNSPTSHGMFIPYVTP